MRIDNSDWFVDGNSLLRSKSDWVVIISPDGTGGYAVKFGAGKKGDGSPFLPMFIRATLDRAFALYDKYKDIIMFEDLKKQVENDIKDDPGY